MEIPGWPGTGNQFIFEPTLKWLKQQSWLGPFFVGWQAGDRSQTHAPSTEIQPCLRENQYSGHKATQSPSYIIQFIRVENNEEPYTFIKPSWWSAQECAADDMQQTWKRHTVPIPHPFYCGRAQHRSKFCTLFAHHTYSQVVRVMFPLATQPQQAAQPMSHTQTHTLCDGNSQARLTSGHHITPNINERIVVHMNKQWVPRCATLQQGCRFNGICR